MPRRLLSRTILLALLTLPAWIAAPAAGQSFGTPVAIELPGAGHDLELDSERQRLYVSVPTADQVLVISLSSFQVIETFEPGQSPRGLDLSPDGATLWVALGASGSVAAIDLESGEIHTLDVSLEIGDPRIWDVVEARPGRLFVSAAPNGNGVSYIVQVKLDEGGAISYAAGLTIISCEPVFAVSSDGNALYIGECFYPESLYKLDLSLDDAPLVLQDDHNDSVFGTHHLALNPEGTRIFTAGGQALATSTLSQVGAITAGPSQVSDDGRRVYVATGAGLVVHDAATYEEIATVDLPCAFDFPTTLRILPGETGYVVLEGERLCGVSEIPPVCFNDSSSLCLNRDRFRVEVAWRDFQNKTGFGTPVSYRADDSGIFWFFGPRNWELMVKVLDACALTDSFWVFSAATTTVEYTLRITDTLTGTVKEYENPLGRAAPAVTDTAGFPCT